MSLFFTTVPTRLGVFIIVMSYTGVRRLTLPGQPLPDLKHIHETCRGGLAGTTDHSAAVFRGLPDQLRRYACGEAVDFDYKLDLDQPCTPFRSRVYKEVRQIPRGATRTYGDIAASVGNLRGARAVGQCLKHNPVPLIVPCHRVILSGGEPGGFIGGYALKRKLLKLENCLIQTSGTISVRTMP